MHTGRTRIASATLHTTIFLTAIALVAACGDEGTPPDGPGTPTGDSGSAAAPDVGATPTPGDVETPSGPDAGATTKAPVSPPPPAGSARFAKALKSFGESKVLSTKASSEARTAPAPKRVAVAMPPLPGEATPQNSGRFGVSSTGRGGGGTGEGTVGLGGLSTIGHGGGGGSGSGYGRGAGGLRGRRSRSASGGAPGGAVSSAAPPPPSAAPAMPASPAPAAAPRPAPSRAKRSSSAMSDSASAPTKSVRRGALAEMAESESARPMSRRRPQMRVPQLTAGAVADVDHRMDYLGYLQRHRGEGMNLNLDMSRRVRFLVVDSQRRPVHDAYVTLVGQNDRPVTGRTHADGIWDFFPGVIAPWMSGQVSVHVQSAGVSTMANVDIPAQGDGNAYVIPLQSQGTGLPNRLDLSFVIDVTGSMGDELRYVTEEVTGIVQRVQAAVPNVEVRVASTFYRDRSDGIPIEQIPFSSQMSDFVTRMRYVQATGGGDYPEDLSSGLAAAMTTLNWSEAGTARVVVVIADAPPQRYGDSQYTYREAMQDASRRGIRLLPVAASGSNPTVEYLFRAMGSLTSTPYVYLTDDSGIGGSHMEADSQNVSREMFSDLLTRLLIAELQGEGMH